MRLNSLIQSSCAVLQLKKPLCAEPAGCAGEVMHRGCAQEVVNVVRVRAKVMCRIFRGLCGKTSWHRPSAQAKFIVRAKPRNLLGYAELMFLHSTTSLACAYLSR